VGNWGFLVWVVGGFEEKPDGDFQPDCKVLCVGANQKLPKPKRTSVCVCVCVFWCVWVWRQRAVCVRAVAFSSAGNWHCVKERTDGRKTPRHPCLKTPAPLGGSSPFQLHNDHPQHRAEAAAQQCGFSALRLSSCCGNRAHPRSPAHACHCLGVHQ